MELLDFAPEILMHMTEQLFENGRGKNDLKNLRQVNRTFNEIASRMLFKEISVSLVRSTIGSTRIDFVRGMLDDPGFLQSAFIQYPRNLLLLVLAIGSDSEESVEMANSTVPRLMAALPNLTGFNLFMAVRYEKVLKETMQSFFSSICGFGDRIAITVDIQGLGFGEHEETAVLEPLYGLTDLSIGGRFRDTSEISRIIDRSPKLERLSVAGRTMDFETVLSSISTENMPRSLRGLCLEGAYPPWTEKGWSKLRALKSLSIVCGSWLDAVKRKRMWNSLRGVGISLERLTFNTIEGPTLDYLRTTNQLSRLEILLPHTAYDMDTTLAGVEGVAARFWKETLPGLMPKLRKLELMFVQIHNTRPGAEDVDEDAATNVTAICGMFSLLMLGEQIKELRMENLAELRVMVPAPTSTSASTPASSAEETAKFKIPEMLANLINKAKNLRRIRLYFILPAEVEKDQLASKSDEVAGWTTAPPFRDGVFLTVWCRASIIGDSSTFGARAVRYLSCGRLESDGEGEKAFLGSDCRRFVSALNRWAPLGERGPIDKAPLVRIVL